VYATRGVSIHAFRGEGDDCCRWMDDRWLVSIHAFRGEGDSVALLVVGIRRCFNPRLPGGRRRESAALIEHQALVSIHAFRGEGDARYRLKLEERALVSIHAFRGEGDRNCASHSITSRPFQSTPSGGKATRADSTLVWRFPVSIHAFRGEGDTR